MELKNAVAICLISFFSATLVMLIARALDIQAASRIEPQLARIVEELESLRKQGGLAARSNDTPESESIDDGLIVYYFHGNTRCPTCRAIESQAHQALRTGFASRLENGDIVWKVLNYEKPAGADLAKKFEIQMPVVVLVRMHCGQVKNWNRLDKVWALVGDKPAFAKYVLSEIDQMLNAAKSQDLEPSENDASEIPIPGGDPPDIPVPSDDVDSAASK